MVLSPCIYCAAGASVTTTTGTKIAKIVSPYYLGSYWTATPVVIINDTNYSCIVTAENNAGETLASSPTTITPAATYLLSVGKVGTTNGGGTVTSSPAGISCGSTCTVTMSGANSVTANFLGTPTGGSYYWLNWTCSSPSCSSLMGGASGSVGNYCTLSDCNACRTTGCIGIFGATCSLTAASTQRVVPPSNGTCLKLRQLCMRVVCPFLN